LIDEVSVVKLAKLLIRKPIGVKAKETRFGEESFKILDLYCSVINKLELDATTTNFSVGLEIISKDRGQDKFGTIYYLSPHGEPFPVEGPIKNYQMLKVLIWYQSLGMMIFQELSM